jgi:nucleoid-associated protein YgaU
MDGMGANKLMIIRGKVAGPTVVFDPRDIFVVQFNPTEYSTEKRSQYSEAAIPGLGSPVIQYGHGDAESLSIELLLDTYTTPSAKKEDVRLKYISRLERFLAIDGELHAPPPCKVVWGSLEFVGVLESLRKNYVLFTEDGTPVRVRATLSWKEYQTPLMQLMETPRFSPDRRKRHVLREGDSLWQLAYEYYGDVSRWKVIAEANDMPDPLDLPLGEELVIPALERQRETRHGG